MNNIGLKHARIYPTNWQAQPVITGISTEDYGTVFGIDAFSALLSAVRIAFTVDMSLQSANSTFHNPHKLCLYCFSLLFLSKNFQSVSSRHMTLNDAGLPGGFLGFGSNTSLWISHNPGKLSSFRYFRHIFLNISRNSRMACFSATFGIRSEPEGFFALRRSATSTSLSWDNRKISSRTLVALLSQNRIILSKLAYGIFYCFFSVML